MRCDSQLSDASALNTAYYSFHKVPTLLLVCLVRFIFFPREQLAKAVLYVNDS